MCFFELRSLENEKKPHNPPQSDIKKCIEKTRKQMQEMKETSLKGVRLRGARPRDPTVSSSSSGNLSIPPDHEDFGVEDSDSLDHEFYLSSPTRSSHPNASQNMPEPVSSDEDDDVALDTSAPSVLRGRSRISLSSPPVWYDNVDYHRALIWDFGAEQRFPPLQQHWANLTRLLELVPHIMIHSIFYCYLSRVDCL